MSFRGRERERKKRKKKEKGHLLINSTQYAQRARAIQSKPRIQQVSDDGDMRQLIDRLRAEIAFLREQLKNNNEAANERASKEAQGSRSGRSGEKEIELQNQLLDIQENYNALSQRHAKLISEITRARDTEEPPTSIMEYTDTAVDRLKRSNSFAEAVEQVVLGTLFLVFLFFLSLLFSFPFLFLSPDNPQNMKRQSRAWKLR